MLQQKNQAKKVILITGGARRIGAAISRYLHHHDYRVIIHYHQSQDEAIKLCDELNALTEDSAQLCQADLTDFNQLPQFIQQVMDCWQRLDGLINNASVFFPTPFGTTTSEQWDTLFNSNVKAPFFLTQLAVPYLQQTHGNIINISDTQSRKASRNNYIPYCMSKAALEHFTHCLAREMGPHIRVNSIAPGPIMSPEGENLLTPELKQEIIQQIPLHRWGDAENIAQAVLFLLENSYINGTTITVDGGKLVK